MLSFSTMLFLCFVEWNRINRENGMLYVVSSCPDFNTFERRWNEIAIPQKPDALNDSYVQWLYNPRSPCLIHPRTYHLAIKIHPHPTPRRARHPSPQQMRMHQLKPILISSYHHRFPHHIDVPPTLFPVAINIVRICTSWKDTRISEMRMERVSLHD